MTKALDPALFGRWQFPLIRRNLYLRINVSSSNHELSPREVAVIRLAAEGLTDTAIGQRLGISESTVSTYWGRVRGKYGPRPRAEIVAQFIHEESRRELEELRGRYVGVLSQVQHLVDDLLPHDDESLFRAMIENAPDPILLVDRRGGILLANCAASELFGYREGEMQQATLGSLIPPPLRERHKEHVDAFFASPRSGRMGEHLRTQARLRSGEEILVEADINVVQHRAESLAVVILRRSSLQS